MPLSIWGRIKNNQVLRFLFSAGVGFLVDASTFWYLYHFVFTGKSYQISSFTFRNASLALAISYCLGVAVNFTLTRYVVFAESKSSPGKQFGRFFLVAIIGFGANFVILKLLIQVLNLYPPLARILAALSLFGASFFIHKVFSFSLSIKHKSSYETESDHQPGNRSS